MPNNVKVIRHSNINPIGKPIVVTKAVDPSGIHLITAGPGEKKFCLQAPKRVTVHDMLQWQLKYGSVKHNNVFLLRQKFPQYKSWKIGMNPYATLIHMSIRNIERTYRTGNKVIYVLSWMEHEGESHLDKQVARKHFQSFCMDHLEDQILFDTDIVAATKAYNSRILMPSSVHLVEEDKAMVRFTNVYKDQQKNDTGCKVLVSTGVNTEDPVINLPDNIELKICSGDTTETGTQTIPNDIPNVIPSLGNEISDITNNFTFDLEHFEPPMYVDNELVPI